jgi:hypothetical protein
MIIPNHELDNFLMAIQRLGAGSTAQDHLFRDFKPRGRFHENLSVELPVKVSLLNFSAVLGGEGKDRAQRCELGEGLDRLVVLVDALVCVEPCATTRGFVLLDFAVAGAAFYAEHPLTTYDPSAFRTRHDNARHLSSHMTPHSALSSWAWAIAWAARALCALGKSWRG